MDIDGRFWIEMNGLPLAGRGRIELLERIRDSGSIRSAAVAMKMSYKAAWEAVDAINQISAEPVVMRTKGGKSGGGTILTERGFALVAMFRQMEKEHFEFLSGLANRFERFMQAPALPVQVPGDSIPK